MFKYHTLHIKRTLPLALLTLVLVGGVFLYAKNQEIINNFRPYYYKAYEAAIRYKLGHPVQAVANNGDAVSVPVLLYHGIITDKSEGESTNIADFINQLLALKKAGYETISMDEYYKFIYEGKPVPKKSFLLTFDDGRKDSYYAAEPLLEALNYRATMFVITSKSITDKSSVYYLSKSEIKEMSDSGRWDIETHTRAGHDVYPIDPTNKGPFYANKLWLDDQKRYETTDEYRKRVHDDLAGAKADIQNELGTTPIAFAVPFGDIGDGSTNYSNAKDDLLKEASSIYPLTFVQTTTGRPYSQNYIGSKQSLDFRIEPKPDWTPDSILQAISRSDAKSLPYVVTPQISDGWRTPWGNSFTTNGIDLQAGASTTGATTTLDGSYGWHNYSVTANVSLVKGSNFRTLLRQINADTYIDCSYSTDSIKSEQVRNGNAVTLASRAIKFNPAKPMDFVATVKDKAVSCSIPSIMGNHPLTSNITENSLINTGGIGFVVYDKTANNAEGIITKLEVEVAK